MLRRLWSFFGLANIATDGELLAIWRVETFEFTFLKSHTSLGLDCRVNIVTRLTEAPVATTKIDGLSTTVVALIDDKLCSMLLAMGLSSCITVGQALTAYKYLRFIYDLFLFLSSSGSSAMQSLSPP